MRTTAILLLCASLAGCGRKQPNPPHPQPWIFHDPASYPPFDGAKALLYVRQQTAFGPRVPGAPAHEQCLNFLRTELAKCAPKVREQKFSMTGYDGALLHLTNLIDSFLPEAKTRMMLCAHWDSRPRADEEPDSADALRPIPGANDGASGVAVLLHIASILAQHPPPVGVDLVFFDGEDYGKKSDLHFYCLGSKYFSTDLSPDYRPEFGILLDMVGDLHARFPKEGYSRLFAPEIVELIWSSARKIGSTHFIDEPYAEIFDDHHSLNTMAGIKTVDIIDASMVGNTDADTTRRYWHTLDDTADTCSAETLGSVGHVLLYIIYGLVPV